MTLSQPPSSNKRDAWLTHYRHWRSSGLSAAAYCRQYELKVSAFYYWKKLFERSTTTRDDTGSTRSAFIPVAPVVPTAPLTLTVGDVILALPRDATEAELTAWVRALRAS